MILFPIAMTIAAVVFIIRVNLCAISDASWSAYLHKHNARKKGVEMW
jgi:hypothetical protein